MANLGRTPTLRWFQHLGQGAREICTRAGCLGVGVGLGWGGLFLLKQATS